MTQLSGCGNPAPAQQTTYTAGTLKYTKAGLLYMLIWMLWGDFIFTLMEAILPQIMPFLLKDLGASNLTIQVLDRSIAYALAVVLSPAISFSSDRHRGKYGRRMPYMLWTTPLVAMFLILIGCFKDITQWMTGADGTFFGWDISTMYIAVFAVLIVAFDLANGFVNEVWFYLFNDVVPKQFFTRFQALFRMVGTAAGGIFGLWIFPNMLTEWQWFEGVDNFKLVMISAGVAYGVGFTLMCLMVKEGKYPKPPPLVDHRHGQMGVVERFLTASGVQFVTRFGHKIDNLCVNIRTYAKECFSHKFYWYLFLQSICLVMSYASGTFAGLRNLLSLGINMKEMGWMGALTSVLTILILYPAGMLADRVHPFKVFRIAFALNLLNPLFQCMWIFADFGHDWNLYFLLMISIGSIPIHTVRTLTSAPLSMMLYPKSRYGQFCSASTMLRSFIPIFATVFTGWAMDVLEKGSTRIGIPELGTWAYRLYPVWTLLWMLLAFMFVMLAYREWQRLGGVKNFVPPEA